MESYESVINENVTVQRCAEPLELYQASTIYLRRENNLFVLRMRKIRKYIIEDDSI